MSVLLAVVVRPKIGESYALIGADSKRVSGNIKSLETFALENLENIKTDENYQKVFKHKHFVYGYAGRVDDIVIETIKNYINIHDDKLEVLLPNLEKIIKKELHEYHDFINQRLALTFAGKYFNDLALAQVLIDVGDSGLKVYRECFPINKETHIEIFAGRTNEFDLQNEFKDRMNSSLSLKKETAKKYIRKYLKHVSARYPENCNQNIILLEL